MRTLTLSEIAASIGAAPCKALEGSLTIDHVSTDSRTIRPGDLFWALRGERYDGHNFVGEAFAAGARAAVVQSGASLGADRMRHPLLQVPDTTSALGQFAAWYRKSCPATVIAVTGSVGKTSTREAIYAVLRRQWPGVRSLKNYNNEVGVPLSLLEIEPTSRFAVIEMGASASGEIARLTEIAAPEIGVITTISAAHLDGFGSIEGVARAKAELIAGLGREGTAILNADDTQLQAIGTAARCGVLWYGTQEDPYWLFASAKQITAAGDSVTFRLDSGQPVRLSAPGRHQVLAALAAVAVARRMGMVDREIVAGLREYRPAAMRCEVERMGRVTVINDSYNASPAAMWAALEMLGTWPADGHRILVCGDMLELGRYGPELHRQLGEEIARRPAISRCIAVGSLSGIAVEAARKAGMGGKRVLHCASVEEASEVLCQTIRDGDVVLVKASRAMQLERAVEALKRRAAA